jgi:hypothetical protein
MMALVPWVLLGAAVLLAFVFGSGRRQAPAELAEPEPPVSTPSAGGTKNVSQPFAGASANPVAMTPAESRDFRVHIAHEQCEQGAARINELEGRDKFAPDPKTLNELSICLRIGNEAWLKCILGAATSDAAKSCNRRFLSLDHPPP